MHQSLTLINSLNNLITSRHVQICFFVQSVSQTMAVCVWVCVFREHHFNWGDAVAVAAGAQDRDLKQVVSQMGKVSNNQVFLLPFILKIMQVFDGGRAADAAAANCSDRNGGGRDQRERTVMDAEQDFQWYQFRPEFVKACFWAGGVETSRASLSQTGNVIWGGFDVIDSAVCTRYYCWLTGGDEHLGSRWSQSNLSSLVCVMIKVVGTPKYPCGQFSAVDGQLVFLD